MTLYTGGGALGKAAQLRQRQVKSSSIIVSRLTPHVWPVSYCCDKNARDKNAPVWCPIIEEQQNVMISAEIEPLQYEMIVVAHDSVRADVDRKDRRQLRQTLEHPRLAMRVVTLRVLIEPPTAKRGGRNALRCGNRDRTITLTTCGRICIGGRKINLSQVFAGQNVGIKEVAEKIWPVTFMHYDLGFFDQEALRVECAPNPFEAQVLPMSPE